MRPNFVCSSHGFDTNVAQRPPDSSLGPRIGPELEDSRSGQEITKVVGPIYFEGGKTTPNKTKLIGHPRNVARLRKTQVLQTVAIIEKPRSLSINAIVTARMNLRLTVQQASKQGKI